MGKFCIHFLNLLIGDCLAASLPTPTYCQGSLLLARSLGALVQAGLDSSGVIPLLLLLFFFLKLGKLRGGKDAGRLWSELVAGVT